MGNKINIGDNNQIKNTNIVGNDMSTTNPKKKNALLLWILKHVGVIVTAVISGATSAFVAWLITYLCLR